MFLVIKLFIGIVEKPDGEILRFQSIEEPTWEPEPDTDLFFSNYELQVFALTP